jgi:hypothetical protein
MCGMQTWGVHVAEVWAIEGGIPCTPMGGVDRAMATSALERVQVYDVDEAANTLRARR